MQIYILHFANRIGTTNAQDTLCSFWFKNLLYIIPYVPPAKYRLTSGIQSNNDINLMIPIECFVPWIRTTDNVTTTRKIELRQYFCMIRLWARIQRLPHTNFLRKIYKDLLLFHDQGHGTWASRAKAIFVKYNITDENLEHTTSSELDIFLRKFHEVWYEQYRRKLISDIKDDNKNSSYINWLKMTTV